MNFSIDKLALFTKKGQTRIMSFLRKTPTPARMQTWNFEDISDSGERVTHLYRNDCYYAHLSIYRFALQFVQGATVLDAGSGSGYGAAYLSEQGAKFVWGIDVSSKAIQFSQAHFQRPNLRYRAVDLQEISGFSDSSFDLIFSSNVLEHVPDVVPFFRAIWRLLKPDGTVVIAVPPIVDAYTRMANLDNRYHLNIWSPQQWYYVLSQYFAEVQPYRHTFDKPGISLNFSNKPEETRVDENDFSFEPISVDQFSQLGSITAVFLARKPRPSEELPALDVPLTYVDDSFTRPFASQGDYVPVTASLGPIIHDQPVTQTFIATKDGLSGISLLLATYARRNSGPVYFHLQRAEALGTGHYLYSTSIEAADIVDNDWLTITFPPQESRDQKYALKIESLSSDPNNAIAAWICLYDNTYPEGQLFQGDKSVNGTLHFKLIY